jgi:HD-GYP domain-containing protein (c-di-GMP phosphodiesterase class II)
VLLVQTIMARPGMTLAMPIHHPKRPEMLLLKTGAALDSFALGHLRELGISDIWINYPGLEFLAQYVSPVMREACVETTRKLAGVFEHVRHDAHARLEFQPVRRAVADMVESMVNQPMAALYINEVSQTDQPALRRAVNVSFLSVLMGISLQSYLIQERPRLKPGYAREVGPLGLGALLSDIGAQMIAPAALDRYYRTHDDTDPEWRQHVTIGHALLRGEVEPSAAAVVLNHHQNFDGSGYPLLHDGDQDFAPAGSKIHVFSRIAAVADWFDHLRWGTFSAEGVAPSKPMRPVVRVLRMLRESPLSRLFDPVCVRAMVAVAPPYPPGSIVTITGEQQCVVVDWSPLDPCRPIVQPIGDLSKGELDEGNETIDLRRERDLMVTHIEGHDVSKDNFAATSAAEFDLSTFYRQSVDGQSDDPDRALRRSA